MKPIAVLLLAGIISGILGRRDARFFGKEAWAPGQFALNRVYTTSTSTKTLTSLKMSPTTLYLGGKSILIKIIKLSLHSSCNGNTGFYKDQNRAGPTFDHTFLAVDRHISRTDFHEFYDLCSPGN